jgi:hypothetical protein
VGNVLESPRYKGEVSFKGSSFRGHHDAIVTP